MVVSLAYIYVVMAQVRRRNTLYFQLEKKNDGASIIGIWKLSLTGESFTNSNGALTLLSYAFYRAVLLAELLDKIQSSNFAPLFHYTLTARLQ